nr:ABC transporter substrate-binding protein [Aurantimonas sp. VKM B-3413]
MAGAALLPILPGIGSAKARPRIASLDYALAETLVALGHPPIALASAADWGRWVVEPKLPEGVVDLGSSLEINFELLAKLEPDLILTTDYVRRQEPALRRIADTVRLTLYEPGALPLDRAYAAARTLGDRLSLGPAADALIARADRHFDVVSRRVRALSPPPVLLVNFLDPRHVRVYGGTGLFQNVLDRIGLENAWRGEANYWGFATVGIEDLATRDDLRLLAFDPVPPHVWPTLRESPLWTRLPFVRAGAVTVLPPVLTFGAIPSAMRFARLVVDALEGRAT